MAYGRWGYSRYKTNFPSVAGASQRLAMVETYTASQVWAAACAAQRINNGYLKDPDMEYNDPQGNPIVPPILKRQANKHLMRDLLANQPVNAAFSITAQDIADGEACRAHYQGLLFKKLAGELKSGFLEAVFENANTEEFKSNEYVPLAQIAAAPAGWKRDTLREVIKERAADGDYLGAVGEKVEGEVEITQSNYSANYGIYFNSGFINGNHVFFAHKTGLKIGDKVRVKGTIKALRDNNTTQLNRVKIV